MVIIERLTSKCFVMQFLTFAPKYLKLFWQGICLKKGICTIQWVLYTLQLVKILFNIVEIGKHSDSIAAFIETNAKWL